MDDPADVVIIGGGSAGCVLANRLSADLSRRVVLIEAGIDTPPGAVPPEIADSYPMPLFFGDRYLWPSLKVTTHRDAQGQPVNRLYEQGRVMGGGSSVNVQAANRGLPRDFDEWESLGACGWGWQDVLPYFRKLETDLNFSGPLHGDSGPLPIRRIRQEAWPPFAAAAARAFAASGLPIREDQNGEPDDGIYPPAFSNRNDRRVSAADAYLTASIRQRANLRILAETEVLRLLLSTRRAEGVVARRADGSLLTILSRHVVLAAGALQSPALLLRAGIGPGADLQTLRIPVTIDRPGVGHNLRDHPALTFCQYLPKALRLPPDFRRASLMALRFSSGMAGGEASDM
ncbi:MAG TPA: GMC family oxidoreductase N-terminal domain-containing protein, partial [Acetobacteraceae bacterium]|nr:GMC family oxidoreductase N-terminal domain-containing protein [Acetobacteraceae bacterium]